MANQFTKDVLTLDSEKEVNKITGRIRELLSKQLKRRGLVVALSGGIDSSVTTALAVKAIGAGRVIVLLMPEQHSADETLDLSSMVADHFGVEKVHEDISDILDALGCYRRYDRAVERVIPEYGQGWKSKIITPNVIEKKASTYFRLWLKNRMAPLLKSVCPCRPIWRLLRPPISNSERAKCWSIIMPIV